jgi:hypothetical protein
MIREVKESDIKGLNSLPPIDWKYDYEAFLQEFINEDFFNGFIQIMDESIKETFKKSRMN